MATASEERRFDVFLSYQRGDADWVGRFRRALEGVGLSVWQDVDQVQPGDYFAERLEAGLAASSSCALVISRASLESAWVKEEYYRALGLANATRRSLRLIPVLIDDVEVPGFLASRSWLDLRSPEAFEAGVEALRRAVASDSQPPSAGAPTAHSSAPPSPQDSRREVEYLNAALVREQATIRRLQLTRAAAVGVGAGMSLWTWHPSGTLSVIAASLPPLVLGLVAWAATASTLARSRPAAERMFHLRGALSVCCESGGDGCSKIWAEFWRTLHQNAGVDAV